MRMSRLDGPAQVEADVDWHGKTAVEPEIRDAAAVAANCSGAASNSLGAGRETNKVLVRPR